MNNTNQISRNASIHEGRWGFHPVDYTTYLKLKAIHKAWWQTVYELAEWHRWARKAPKHRNRPEPQVEYLDLFVKYNDETPETGWMAEAVRSGMYNHHDQFARRMKRLSVVADFQSARTPRERAGDVVPIGLTDEQIDALFLSVSA